MFNLKSLMLIFLLAWLAGCAARPGPHVLDLVSANTRAKTITAYVATTRGLDDKDPSQFNNSRSLSLTFAKFVISIPPNHKQNAIEWPSGKADASTSFAVIERQILTRQQFSAEVAGKQAREGTTAIPNTAVFVHGYNTNFQEALFRLAQMTADSNLNGTPILVL